MQRLLDVNFNYVSKQGFEKFVKEKLSNLPEEFSKDEFIGDTGKMNAKTKNMLKFSSIVGIITINGSVRKNNDALVKEYFNLVDSEPKKATEVLAKLVLRTDEFQEIISLLKTDNISRADFIHFLKKNDENQYQNSRYISTAMAIANMLYELRLIGKVKTKGGRIKRNKETIRNNAINESLRLSNFQEENRSLINTNIPNLIKAIEQSSLTKDELNNLIEVLYKK